MGTIDKNDLRGAFDNVGVLMSEGELDELLGEIGGACTLDNMVKMFQEKMSRLSRPTMLRARLTSRCSSTPSRPGETRCPRLRWTKSLMNSTLMRTTWSRQRKSLDSLLLRRRKRRRNPNPSPLSKPHPQRRRMMARRRRRRPPSKLYKMPFIFLYISTPYAQIITNTTDLLDPTEGCRFASLNSNP